jgi:hypothetical protein
LEDGHLLSEVLERVAPADSPLEGSLLGSIFNPVILLASDHRPIRGWTDFAMGGMTIVEDRFAARSYGEFRGCAVACAVDLLHVLRMAERPLSVLSDIVAVAEEAAESAPPDALIRTPLRGPSAGLEDMIRVWKFEHHLARVRQSVGCRWPVSFDDLCLWIDRCATSELELDADTETAFVHGLLDLAVRRFPAG